MALMASTSLTGVSVHTGYNPCDVHVHGGAASNRRAKLAARLACRGGDAFKLGGACACCLLGSLLLRCLNREQEQYENGNESRHLILK